MNEAKTRAEFIDPKPPTYGWNVAGEYCVFSMQQFFDCKLYPLPSES
jgi:hypothetical protein